MFIRKQFIAKTLVNEAERTVTAIISTNAVDRDNEVLLPRGADIDQYLKNPVFLWAHDYGETPIGKAMWIKKGNKKITAQAKFAETEKAEEIYQLYKGGFLKAFSVGFNPIKSHAPTPDEIRKNPEWANAFRIYDEWELLEFSAVPVPANPEALSMAVKSLSLSEDTQNELASDDYEEMVKEIQREYLEEDSKDNTEVITEIKVNPVFEVVPVVKALPQFKVSEVVEFKVNRIDLDQIAMVRDMRDKMKGKMFST